MASTAQAGRRRIRKLLALALSAVSVAALVACSGGGSSDKTGTASPTATPTEKPHVQPTIEGGTFNFPARGYGVLIPNGWHANPNSLLAGTQAVDTFFSADTTDGVQSNISVTCEDNPSNVGTDQFVQTRMNTLGTLGAQDVKTLGPANVGGVQGQKISYTLVRDKVTIQKTDIMFATKRCAWVLALSSAPSAQAQNGTVFDNFVQSFRLTDDTLS